MAPLSPSLLRQQHCPPLLSSLDLDRQFRITEFLSVEIGDRDLHSMFHLNFTKLVQIRSPFTVLRQIIGYSFGKQNVAGIATIHHPLRQVDARPSYVGSIIDIGNFIHWSAVDSHSQLQRWILSQLAADLPRATHRRIHTGKEGQHHSIPGRQPDQSAGRFRRSKLRGITNNLV